MKAIVLVATLLVATLSGTAFAAQGPPDDSAFTVDLTAAGGPVVYVMCGHATSLANCQNPTLWQESNGLGKLQSARLITPTKRYDPDSRLLA
jgi:hypothetical protein